jgi:thiol:disulfide interchange protein DsbA
VDSESYFVSSRVYELFVEMRTWRVEVKSLILVTLFISMLSAVTVPAAGLPTGFQQVPQATPAPNPTRIEVIDFFWYGCPYCNLFEPYLQDWLASKPENVNFIRIPAVIRPGWSNHARVFYTAQILGVLDSLHEQFYTSIHEDDQDLDNMNELAGIFAAQGIERARFEKVFKSDEVTRKVQEAGMLTRRYGIDSVPAIVVNGEYRTNPVLAGGASRMLDAVNELIQPGQTIAP